MTHDEFRAILADYLEDGALSAEQRAKADAHLIDCAECSALVADLRKIVTDAAALPMLTPQRDLWAGIDARIETPVFSLGRRTSTERRAIIDEAFNEPAPSFAPMYRRLAIAASLLVAVTAGVTWSIASRAVPAGAVAVNSAPVTGGKNGAVKNVNRPSASETFDREITSLRRIVDERRGDLDSGTVVILEKNLRLIDNAIAESKAALARDPASAFLTDRLNRAYDSKLQMLRSVATIPARS